MGTLKNREFNSVLDRYVLNKESRYQVQYVDYDDNTWTVPILLTPERASYIKSDGSVRKIKILWRSVEIILIPGK